MMFVFLLGIISGERPNCLTHWGTAKSLHYFAFLLAIDEGRISLCLCQHLLLQHIFHYTHPSALEVDLTGVLICISLLATGAGYVVLCFWSMYISISLFFKKLSCCWVVAHAHNSSYSRGRGKRITTLRTALPQKLKNEKYWRCSSVQGPGFNPQYWRKKIDLLKKFLN